MDLLSIAISFISISIAVASVVLTFRSIRDLRDVKTELGVEFSHIKATNEDTQHLIERVARLFDASEKVGLDMIYKTRKDGLDKFRDYIRDDEGEIVIVGSSLVGLFFSIDDFDRIVEKKAESFRFILTHPDFSDKREGPEGRTGLNRISGEVIEGVNRLLKLNVPEDNIRLYRGSPTVFMIMIPQHMLLNPYPYGEMAYHCFCIEISDNGPIFRQYYEKHYKKIWDSDWVEKVSDFRSKSGNKQKIVEISKLERLE